MNTLTIGFVVTALASLAAGAGCGKAAADSHGTSTENTPVPAVLAPAASKPEPTATEAPKAVAHVEIHIETLANTMTFDKTALTVPAGAEVHLVLKNNATMTTLPHNWALVKPGTEAGVAAAGLKMGDPAGYFDVRDKDALAHTPMAKPGETSEVTFTAPEAGTYPYICTVPGHYMMMNGVLTVTP
jgi:azurin